MIATVLLLAGLVLAPPPTIYLEPQDSAWVQGATSAMETIWLPYMGLEAGEVSLFWWREDGQVAGCVTTPATFGSWTACGFNEVNEVEMPGYYHIGLPNEVLEAGAEHAVMEVWLGQRLLRNLRFDLVPIGELKTGFSPERSEAR